MKKLSIFVIFSLFFAISKLNGASISENTATSNIMKADLLIDSRAVLTPNGWNELKGISTGITPFYRYEIYKTHEKNWVGAFALNFFLPGVGSWTMGDWIGGLGVELGMAAGLGIVFGLQNVIPQNGIIMGYSQNPVVSTIALIGFALFSSALVVNWVIPFTYGISWNDNLRNSLGLTGDCWSSAYRYTIINLPVKTDILYLPIVRYRF